MVSAIVHFLGLQPEHIARTSDHAKVTSLATLGVDSYSTSDFSHLLLVLSYGLRSGDAGSDNLTNTVNFSIGKITKFFAISNNIFLFFC